MLCDVEGIVFFIITTHLNADKYKSLVLKKQNKNHKILLPLPQERMCVRVSARLCHSV